MDQAFTNEQWKQAEAPALQAISEAIPTVGVKTFVENLAKQHGVTYVKTNLDALAKVFTELSGDTIEADETEDLIVALRRAKVIDGPTFVTILGRYLDEKSNVSAAKIADQGRIPCMVGSEKANQCGKR